MTEIAFVKKPLHKIYKDRAIWAGTFLGGPLAAGYLIAHNFNAFNEPRKAKMTWIYSIIATIIIFGGVFLIPDPDKIPRQIVPLIYTAIAYFLVQRFQGKLIETHLDAGGKAYSWWKAAGIGLVGTVITVILLFFIISVFGIE